MDHWGWARLGLLSQVGEDKKTDVSDEMYIKGFLLEPGAKIPQKEPLTYGKIFRSLSRLLFPKS